ncbi:MAG: hypothetical protein ACJAVV_002810 [Alphaproteobacteria bacterium]|jgi:hypothetical protein
MTTHPKFILGYTAAVVISALSSGTVFANTVYDSISQGKVNADFNLRYEGVQQDNAVGDASALTFRTRIGYTSADYEGWSFKIEMEDNRIVLGQGDYTVGPTGYNLGQYSVIADPEFTELDQGFIQYKSDNLTLKVGRQVITLDGHRFVGHVGWRQDRQTFDAATVIFSPIKDLKIQYSHVTDRNRIFAEIADQDSKDHLFNASYVTSLGKLVAYGYLLERELPVSNSLDTYGVSFSGKKVSDDLTWLYHAEVASQKSDVDAVSFSANYLFAELGAQYSGVTAKLGYEVLGSDNGSYGFATPLATLHKFNGWSDQFLATPQQGLTDIYLSASTKALGGNLLAVYHKFDADDASETVDDLGSEINLQYTTKIASHYTAAIKYAKYNGESGRVDADKIWVWLSTKF